MNDPDAIWKPGYDGPPPIVEAPRAAGRPHAESDPPDDAEHPTEGIDPPDPGAPPSRPRSSGRRLGVVGALALGLGLVLVAAALVLDPWDSGSTIDRPDPTVFGGPEARRLPSDATPLWSLDIEAGGEQWVDVIRRDLVVAAVADPADGPGTTLVALGALTGEQRWAVPIAAEPSDVAVIGSVDDVLVLGQQDAAGPIATGIDVATGETRWTDEAASSGHVGLAGTPFVARLPSAPDEPVALIDAVSGREQGTIASDVGLRNWSTDRGGTWYVVDDGDVVGYDLSEALEAPTVIAALDDISRPRIVVGGRIATVDGSGSLTFDGAGTDGTVTVSDDVPKPIRSLTSTSDSDFVVTAPRSIAGVSTADDTADLAWLRNDGEVVDDHPVEGGTMLLVATRGGAAMQLVDASTGDTVEHLTLTPGALQALLVAGDGFVALKVTGSGTNLAGFDLDGTERWSIAGTAPAVVGDRIVVRAVPNDATGTDAGASQQLRITAYGDIE